MWKVVCWSVSIVSKVLITHGGEDRRGGFRLPVCSAAVSLLFKVVDISNLCLWEFTLYFFLSFFPFFFW